jgi:uncharacterized protein YbjT (DUF2867 family)
MSATEGTAPVRPGPIVTGATGFIGHHLVARLLARDGGSIHVLVREGSLPRFGERLRRWNAPPGRVSRRRGSAVRSRSSWVRRAHR